MAVRRLLDITYGIDKLVKTEFPDIKYYPYWPSTCLSFIDSIPAFIATSLLSVIRLMTQTHLILM